MPVIYARGPASFLLLVPGPLLDFEGHVAGLPQKLAKEIVIRLIQILELRKSILDY